MTTSRQTHLSAWRWVLAGAVLAAGCGGAPQDEGFLVIQGKSDDSSECRRSNCYNCSRNLWFIAVSGVCFFNSNINQERFIPRGSLTACDADYPLCGNASAAPAERASVPPNTTPPNAAVSNRILPIHMIFYGDHNAHNNGTNKRIADAKPETLICNTPAGAWTNGGCNPRYFQSHGIKVYSYLAGGWENTAAASNRQVNSSVEFNVGRIGAIALEGSDGVFLDEVSHHPTNDGWKYLLALSNAAKKEGEARGRSLPIICNVGTMVWEPMLSVVCDEIHASEHYGRIYNTNPDDPYTFWDPDRAKSNLPVMMSTMAVTTADQAVALTVAARGQNISSHCATGTYTELPWWLEDYVAALRKRLP